MSNVDFAALSGNFKEAYASEIADNIPDSNIVTRMTKFEKGEKLLGNYFHIPVKVRSNVGATYNNDGSAFTILTAIAMQLEDAQLRGSEILIPAPISYAAVTRSAGKNSFGRAVDLTVEDLRKSMRKRVELGLLYGGADGTGLGTSVTVSSGTTGTLTITLATWAPAIWSGLTGVQLNLYKASDNTQISSGPDAIFTLDSVDIATRVLNISGTTTGITALGTNSVNVFFRGSHDVEMTGLQTILSNTGDLFGIDAGDWEVWQGNTYAAASAQLTFEKLQDAASYAVARGCEEELTALVSVPSFAKLNSELAGARVLDSSYSKSKGENGVEAIEFYGANGKMKVVAHPYMKGGMAMIVPMGHIHRIGSTEPTFQPVPGTDMVFHQNGTAGVEVRVYTDQAVISDAPSYGVLVTGIVN